MKLIKSLLVGILACLILFEIVCYGSAFIFSQSKNKLNIENYNSNKSVVLCFGDSTTAVGGKESWPYQLKYLLDKNNQDFSVINLGEVLIDTTGILNMLNESVEEYNPEIVIIMAGINDVKKKPNHVFIKKLLHNFRTYRLLEQFWPDSLNPEPIDYENTEIAYRYDPTISNFNNIHSFLIEKNITLIIMQYPLRNITPLKQVFNNNQIIFIDNQELFESKLNNTNYNEYFVDSFAGDFGHCTKKGNYLIAENVFNVFMEEKLIEITS